MLVCIIIQHGDCVMMRSDSGGCKRPKFPPLESNPGPVNDRWVILTTTLRITCIVFTLSQMTASINGRLDSLSLIWYCVVFSQLSYRQDKRMDELNLFIDYHYKSIVSIIWARHVLTLHLSHTNWRKLKLSHCCQLQEHSFMLFNFYQIESYHTFSGCNPLLMEDEETLILLYH